ncbi:MAG: lysophospholipase [Lautropia sp.]
MPPAPTLPEPAPPAGQASPHRRSLHLTMPDGVDLHVEDWLIAEGERARGAVLVVHGLGEHFGRYAHVARALNALGFEVRGYDQRGFGRSGGARGAIPGADALVDDARSVFDDWARRCGCRPFLLGHSMGGAVAARAATGGWIAPRGLVLASPALGGRISAFGRLRIALGRRLLPDRAVASGIDPDHVSRDRAVVADYRRDPLNHGLISPRLAGFIVDAGPASIAAAAKLAVPVLLLLAGDDRLVDNEAARRFGRVLPPGRLTEHVYPGCYHELFNAPAAQRERVLADLEVWLLRIAASAA